MTRSAAEQEIRDCVVDRLRDWRPSARIVHELNFVTPATNNRIDVAAISEAEIIAVEIKSERDKMDRAPSQLDAMTASAHYAIFAIHEVHLIEQKSNNWAAHYTRDGVPFIRVAPSMLRTVETWIYPETKRGKNDMQWKWREPDTVLCRPLPAAALHLLWRDELAELCASCRMMVRRRATMEEMISALRWYQPGSVITKGICAALRRRTFAEADNPISDAA